MNVDFSPEIRLLFLTCAVSLSPGQKAGMAAFLRQQPIRWERVYTLAVRHRLTPFLYRSLAQLPAVPATFLKTLQEDCRTAAADNLLKLHHYRQLATLLTHNGIDHLALKGIYLAEQHYPDSSLRISGDIDVLIRPEDVFKTIRLLQANGYALNNQQGLHWQQGDDLLLNDLYEISLLKPFFNNSHFDIDLHWKVLCFNGRYQLFDLNYVVSQPAFSAERKLVLLVTHHGVMNAWQQLYYINDLYFSLYQQPINWEELLSELQRYGLDRVFLAGLYWCVRIWGLALPPTVETLVQSADIGALANRYATGWEADKPSEYSKLIVKQLSLFLNAQTKLSRKLTIVGTFLTSRVFRFSIFNVRGRFIYVPKELGFMTLFIRAIQSLTRFLPTRR